MPIAFVGLGIYQNKVVAFALLGAAIALAPFIRGLTIIMGMDGTDILSHRFSFLHHMDMLAIGCLGAFSLWHFPRILTWTENHLKMAASLGLIFLSLPFVGRNIQGMGIETVFGPTIQAFGFLLLVLSSISAPNLPLFRPLQWRPVVWVGTISYSLYLWHAPFLTGRYFGDGDNLLVMFGLPVLILAAALSYHLLELPILGLRRRYRVNDETVACDSARSESLPGSARPNSET